MKVRTPKLRSHVHMLTVAAARMEQDYANPKLVEALREAAKKATLRVVEGRNWTEEETRRVERQRTAFNMLPSSDATDRFKEAMLQRAYDLLWDGDTSACDALTEFLPDADVLAMLDAWEGDHFVGANETRSKWYR